MSPQIAASTQVDRAGMLEFARPRHHAILITARSDDFGGPWLQIDGDAQVLDRPEALEPLAEYYRSISGEHPDWDEYRAATRRQGKSLILITPRRWGPVATGGFPARLST